MDYDLVVVTSPTELLSAEAFPALTDTTDLNGNAMHQSKAVVSYRKKSRPSRKIRCLVFALVLFIITSIVMASLFAWRMMTKPDALKTPSTDPPCYVRAMPRKFTELPRKIQDYLEILEGKIHSSIEKENSTSVVLMNIVYHDKVIWELKYEKKDNERRFITDNKLFPVASITKVITALLVFKLYNNGHVTSLDDPITKYEPRFKIIPYDNVNNTTQITIRQLITYLSGLPREAPCFPDSDTNFCPYNNSNILQKLTKTKLLFTPGSDFLYGNLQFGVVGHSLTKNYPGGFEQSVHDKIFRAMGMHSSFFTLNDTMKRKMHEPKTIHGVKPKIKEWGWLIPAGGLVTTIDDLAKLEIGLFNNSKSKFIRSALYDEFFSPAYVLPDGKTMLGTSWRINIHNGYSIFAKDGYVYGYDSKVYLNPHLRLAVNFMRTSSNYGVSTAEVISHLTDLFHEELEKFEERTEPVPVSNPERFIGVYRTSDVITLAEQDIVISKSKNVKGNNTHHVLSINILIFNLDLSYIGDNIFEILDNQCTHFELGINGEKLYFEEQFDSTKMLAKFSIYGIHLRGKATFYRKV